MKRYLKLLATLLFAFASGAMMAQQVCELRGVVVDNEGTAIPYATVGAYGKNNKVERKVADINGVFTFSLLQGNSYEMEITSVGFAPYKQVVELPAQAKYDIGAIALQPSAQLEEVVVVAQKPLIKADAEKISYDVTADPSAGTNTVLDMMRKVPLITVDGQENVQMNGSSDFKLLINGKESVVAKNNVKEFLKAMPASSVEEIQVISNPSVRYDAEGTGGVINIITRQVDKTEEVGGVMATLSANYDVLQNSINGNLFLTGQYKKFTISVNYMGGYAEKESMTYMEQTNFNTPDFYQYFSGSVDRAHSKSHYHMFSVESSYELDKKNLFTLGVSGHMSPSRSIDMIKNEAFNSSGDRVMNFINRSNNYMLWGSVSANVNYQHTFDRRQHMITTSYLYEYNPNNSSFCDSTLFDDETLHPSYEGQMNANRSFSHQHTVQIDYNNPLTEMHSIEAGAKYIARLNKSSDDYTILHGGVWQSLGGAQLFDYTQQVASLYAGYAFNRETWGFRVGGRYETTFIDAYFEQGDLKYDYGKPYGNFVPYASINYNISPFESLRLSYTQRINRPGINFLSPYEDWSSATHYSVGNPNLKPTLSHAITAAYSIFKGAFNINMQWRSRITDNAITQLTTVDPVTGVSCTSIANIAQRQSHGLDIFISGMPSPKFNYNISLSPSYNIYSAPHLNKKAAGWGVFCMGGFDVMPWKNGRISVSGGGGKSSETINSIPLSWFYFYGVSIAQTFLDDKLKVTLSANNIFEPFQQWSEMTVGDNYEMVNRGKYQMQSLSIGVSYTFGNLDANVKRARRGIKNDDLVGGAGESRESNQQGGGNMQ